MEPYGFQRRFIAEMKRHRLSGRGAAMNKNNKNEQVGAENPPEFRYASPAERAVNGGARQVKSGQWDFDEFVRRALEILAALQQRRNIKRP
jgi:hypothetical protein